MGYDNAGEFFKNIVANQGDTPLVNYNFMLRIEGFIDVPCRAVRVFQKENEFEYIQEGGLNDYVHMRRKPISKPFSFQVERYVGIEMLDPMSNGTEFVLPLILVVNRQPIKDAESFFNFSRVYIFTGAVVMSKEFGELSADKSGLLVETTTIGYKEMMCLDNPAFDSTTIDKWKFDTGTLEKGYRPVVDYKGKDPSRTYSDKYTSLNKSKADMIGLGKARHWMYKDHVEPPDPFVPGPRTPIKITPGAVEGKFETGDSTKGTEGINRSTDWSPKKETNITEGKKRHWMFADHVDSPDPSVPTAPGHIKITPGSAGGKFETAAEGGSNDTEGINRQKDWSPKQSETETIAKDRKFDFAEHGKKGDYIEIVNRDPKTGKVISSNYKGNGKTNRAEDWSTPAVDPKSDQAVNIRYKPWEFADKGRSASKGTYVKLSKYDGNGKRHVEEDASTSKDTNLGNAKVYPDKKSAEHKNDGPSKKDMEAKAKLYPKDKSAEHKNDGPPKKDMEAKARVYPPTRSARQIAEFLGK